MITAPRSPSQTPERIRQFLVTALTTVLLLAVATIYYPGLHGPFMLDDWGNIEPAILDELRPDKIISAVFGNESGMLGRPVSALSFAITSYFHGTDPFYFKYQNLMLHLLNGVLLFWLGRLLLSEIHPKSGQLKAYMASGLATAIWLAHPLWVSTVLYSVQRMVLLATLFTIGALIAYVSGRRRLAANPQAGLAGMSCGTVIFGALAVLSKESGALLPCFILVIETFVFRFRAASAAAKRSLYLFHIVFIALPIAIAAIYFVSHVDAFLSSYAIRDYTLAERLMTETRVLWLYIGLLLLPRLSNMSLFHDNYPISHHLDPATLLAITGLAALLAVAVWSFRRHPLLGLGITWFFVAHLLESTILPLELVFEHRNYPAAIGLFLMLGYYISRLVKPDKFNRIAGVVVVLTFTGLASMTYVRAQEWGSSELFYRVAVMEHPDSFRAHTSIANIEFMNGHPEAARQHLETALTLSPENAGTMVHMMFTYCHEDIIPPELVGQTVKLLEEGRLVAYGIIAVNLLATSYFHGDCPAMTPDILLNVTFSATRNGIAGLDDRYYLLVIYGKTLQALELHNEAIRIFNESLALARYSPPTNRPLGFVGLAHSYIALGNQDKARDVIRELRELDAHPLISIGDQLRELESLL